MERLGQTPSRAGFSALPIRGLRGIRGCPGPCDPRFNRGFHGVHRWSRFALTLDPDGSVHGKDLRGGESFTAKDASEACDELTRRLAGAP